MRGPDFLPPLLLEPIVSPSSAASSAFSAQSSLNSGASEFAAAAALEEAELQLLQQSRSGSHSAAVSPAMGATRRNSHPTAWPHYEVSSLMTAEGLGETDFVALAAALLAYVPEPLAVRFRQGLVVQDAALPQGDRTGRSAPPLKNSVSWLGELRPAAVAFVKFSIGDLNVDRTGRGMGAAAAGGTSSSGGSVRGTSGATRSAEGSGAGMTLSLTDCDSGSMDMDCCLFLQPEADSKLPGATTAATAAAVATAASRRAADLDDIEAVRELRQASAPEGLQLNTELPGKKAQQRRHKVR